MVNAANAIDVRENRHLEFSKFVDLNFWDYYSLSSQSNLFSKYELVKLEEVIVQRKEWITIDDDKDYKRCRVQLYGRGILLRDIVKGKHVKTKKQQLCKQNDLLVAEIDAKFGGFGIVPDELEGAIVSGHYFLFEIDERKLLVEYLGVVLKCFHFQKQVRATGSTNYAAIRPYHFLEYKIPLPSSEEQKRIVGAYNGKIQLARKQEAAAEKISFEIYDYLSTQLDWSKPSQGKLNKSAGLSITNFSSLSKWAISHSTRLNGYDAGKAKYPLQQIKDLLVFFRGGKTPSKGRKDFWGEGVAWCSPKDFKDTYLKITENQITSTAVKESNMEVFPKGTLISVFRSGILQHSFPTMITEIETTINQDLKAYSFDEKIIIKEFFLHFVTHFKEYILLNASKKSATVESINTEEFLDLQIPIPPLEVQESIVSQVRSFKEKFQFLKQQSSSNRAEAIKNFENEIFQID